MFSFRRAFEYTSGKDLLESSHNLSNKFDAANYGRLVASLDTLDISLLRTEATLSLFDRF